MLTRGVMAKKPFFGYERTQKWQNFLYPQENCVNGNFSTDITHLDDTEDISTVYQYCTQWDVSVFDHALFHKSRDTLYFSISVQEGRRDLSNTGKCSQWPHLFKCYEATQGLKCSQEELSLKNHFLIYATQIDRFFLFWRPCIICIENFCMIIHYLE